MAQTRIPTQTNWSRGLAFDRHTRKVSPPRRLSNYQANRWVHQRIRNHRHCPCRNRLTSTCRTTELTPAASRALLRRQRTKRKPSLVGCSRNFLAQWESPWVSYHKFPTGRPNQLAPVVCDTSQLLSWHVPPCSP